MLKRRSLSTEDGREQSILFATFPGSEIMLRLVFHHLRGIHFSELLLMIISEHFSFLKFVFLHFAPLMLHLMTNHRSRSQSRTFKETRYRIHGLYHSDFRPLGPVHCQWRQSCHCLHSFADLFAETQHSRRILNED